MQQFVDYTSFLKTKLGKYASLYIYLHFSKVLALFPLKNLFETILHACKL